MNVQIDVTEVYEAPAQQEFWQNDAEYAAYLKWFYSRPLSERLIRSTTSYHYWR